MIIAGIDEAGYGPLLGPLVVSASAFQTPGTVLPTEVAELPNIWKLLKPVVFQKNAGKAAAKGGLLIADSKVVHHLNGGDRLLERGVLAMYQNLAMPDGSRGLAEGLCAGKFLEVLGCCGHGLEEHPWYAGRAIGMPWRCEKGDLAIVTNMLRGALARAQVEVRALRTVVVPERKFNQLVGGSHNKASTLISITMTHLYYLHQQFGSEGLVVGVDKQGGRDHYTGLLLQSFPEAKIKVLREDEGGSSYLLQEGATGSGRQTIIHFREKCETHFLPTALASMICKYLRELYMDCFNAWWCGQIENLMPTAGYYQDGMRWLGEVEPHLERLRVRREDLVRCR